MKEIKGFDIRYDFTNFKKIADLIYFEGPLLSHFVSAKGDDYPFYWVDSDDKDNRWLVLRVNIASLQKYITREATLRELISNPNDGYLYCVDVDNNMNFHHTKLVEPDSLPDDYLPDPDTYYEFEPIPSEEATELMTYELTIPFKEHNRFEDILNKIGFPVSALKKVATHAAAF